MFFVGDHLTAITLVQVSRIKKYQTFYKGYRGRTKPGQIRHPGSAAPFSDIRVLKFLIAVRMSGTSKSQT
ncbi:MAG: hypothetical protein UEU90_00080 [Lachnospiraceae bacterium]|nr:hypothetical protein [Lachnospiraceae bacterium]